MLLALAAPFAAGFKTNGIVRRSDIRITTTLLLLFVGILFACYLPYIPFDSWAFLRFLLPGIPVLLVLGCLVVNRLIAHASADARRALAVAFCALLCGTYIHRADDLNIFKDAASQHRYLVVADYVDKALPKNAVVVSLVESGSLRMYGHRKTLRWDVIAPNDFDRTIETLYANALEPYILLEGSERAAFEARFGQTQFGALNWPPMATYRSYEDVAIYSATDRERARSGAAITTTLIPPER